MQFTYDNICTYQYAVNPNDPFATHFRNNWRVTSKTTRDGRGNSYTWAYSYQNPEYNTIGTNITPNHGPNPWPNSAVVYFNDFYRSNDSNVVNPSDTGRLAHHEYTEFRGHAAVTETDPVGNQTTHSFLQGDAGCRPMTVGSNILNDGCFLAIRNTEMLAGRETDNVRYAGAASRYTSQ